MLNSVIVVDDEASIRTAVEQWLSLSGFSVQLFAAPKIAWRSCRALSRGDPQRRAHARAQRPATARSCSG
jgi:DNA-binding NtrC family response regulator